MKDEKTRAKIMETTDPKQIKALGRKIKGFDAALWDANKLQIVINGNLAKFSDPLTHAVWNGRRACRAKKRRNEEGTSCYRKRSDCRGIPV